MIDMLNSPLGLKFALYNIIGNFLMLTPLSVLIPLISDKFKKISKFIIGILISLIGTFLFRQKSTAKNLSELYFRSLIKSNAQPKRLNSLRSNSSRFEAVSLTLIAHSNRLGKFTASVKWSVAECLASVRDSA